MKAPLPRKLPETGDLLGVLVSDAVDLRKNLRQDTPLLVLENTLNLVGKAGILDEKCLKNLGRVGMQPTIIPIAISAKLGLLSVGRKWDRAHLAYAQSPCLSTSNW